MSVQIISESTMRGPHAFYTDGGPRRGAIIVRGFSADSGGWWRYATNREIKQHARSAARRARVAARQRPTSARERREHARLMRRHGGDIGWA